MCPSKKRKWLQERKFKQADITFKTCGIRESKDIRKEIRLESKEMVMYDKYLTV